MRVDTVKTALMAALVACLALPVAAQQPRNCGPRDAMVERLYEGYGETRQAIALGADDRLVEVYASEETGTWTITVTTPNGVMCLMASGQAYENLSEAPRVPGVKS